MLNPILKIECVRPESRQAFLVSFQDGATRCHIWAEGPGEFENTVHRNTPTGETLPDGREKTRHRAGDLDAKKYAKIRERLNQLSPAAFELARKKRERADARAEAKAEAARRACQIEQLRDLADRLGFYLATPPRAEADMRAAADFIVDMQNMQTGTMPPGYWKSPDQVDINSGWRATTGGPLVTEWVRVLRPYEIEE